MSDIPHSITSTRNIPVRTAWVRLHVVSRLARGSVSLPVLLVLSCCADGISDDPSFLPLLPTEQSRDDDAPCDYSDLTSPAAACTGGGDGPFEAICPVDCFENIYPYVPGELSVLPDGRHYGVLFRHQPGLPIPAPYSARGFLGPVNVETQGPVEQEPNNEVTITRTLTPEGDLFVRFRPRILGPTQMAVSVHSFLVVRYAFRVYVGGVPNP